MHKAEIEREAGRLGELSRMLDAKIAKCDVAVALGLEPTAPCEPVELERSI
jgi:hypothetical protein